MSVNEMKDLSLKNIINKLDFFKENSYYSMKHLKKKRIVVARKQILKKYMIPAMLKKAINHL